MFLSIPKDIFILVRCKLDDPLSSATWFALRQPKADNILTSSLQLAL